MIGSLNLVWSQPNDDSHDYHTTLEQDRVRILCSIPLAVPAMLDLLEATLRTLLVQVRSSALNVVEAC